MDKSKLRIKAGQLAQILAILLCAGYGLSLFAAYGWFFDLFSNFAIQYVVGGLALAFLFSCFRKWIWVLPMLIVSALNVYEIQGSYSNPWVFSPPAKEAPNLVVAQYNKLFRNHEWDALRAELERHPEIDVLFVQEVGVHNMYKLQELEDLFPYQFPRTPAERIDDVAVLSRLPVQVQHLPLETPYVKRYGMKVRYQKEGLVPVSLYSLHTKSPSLPWRYAQRNAELISMATLVAQDASPYKIFSGDWNTSAWSPHFQDVLQITGMNYNDFRWFPNVTWPSFAVLPILKTPIDHIIYSRNIIQVDKAVGNSIGSDHHMLIAKFHVPES